MKTILLLRHAKAQPIRPNERDFDRPLAPRGHEDAARVGRTLAAMRLVPDAIVTSPARRAKETAEGVAAALKFQGTLREDRSLYDTSGASWLAALGRLPSSADLGLLVAHNPGIEELAALLVGAPTRFLDCPTAGLVAFESSLSSWKDLGARGATLRWFLRPKLVEAIAT